MRAASIHSDNSPHNLVFYCAVQRVSRDGLAECTGMQTLLFEMQPDHALHTSCASSDVCACLTGVLCICRLLAPWISTANLSLCYSVLIGPTLRGLQVFLSGFPLCESGTKWLSLRSLLALLRTWLEHLQGGSLCVGVYNHRPLARNDVTGKGCSTRISHGQRRDCSSTMTQQGLFVDL